MPMQNDKLIYDTFLFRLSFYGLNSNSNREAGRIFIAVTFIYTFARFFMLLLLILYAVLQSHIVKRWDIYPYLFAHFLIYILMLYVGNGMKESEIVKIYIFATYKSARGFFFMPHLLVVVFLLFTYFQLFLASKKINKIYKD